MEKIKLFYCEVPSVLKTIKIKPNGRNLLIVGQNGSGKTSLLTKLHDHLNTYLQHGFRQRQSYLDQVRNHHNYIKEYPQQNYSSNLKQIRDSYRQSRNKLIINIPGAPELSEAIKNKKAVLTLFKANRKAEIKSVSAAGGVVRSGTSIFHTQTYGSDFEQHLVNLKVRAALAATTQGDSSRLVEIDLWLNKLEEDLKYLFENQTTKLRFDPEQLRFFITQQGKADFTFQELSSGYSAIFDILADLIMRTEHHQLTPQELRGIVLIDEIDAHLHVSLQRKILPFFIRTFPEIQFIVTTHSPFVVTSVDDVLIYDLTSGMTALDLSMYSVETIIEGLLGVPPISKKLEETIKNLRTLTNQESPNYSAAEALVNQLSPFIDSLDDESRMHYEIARNKILAAKPGEANV